MPINAEQTKNPREQPNRSCKQTDKSHETSFPANRCIHAPVPLKPCNDKTRNRQNQPDQSCTDHPNVEETHISKKKDLSETGRLEAGVTKGKGPLRKAAPTTARVRISRRRRMRWRFRWPEPLWRCPRRSRSGRPWVAAS